MNIGVVHPTYFQCNRATTAIEGRDDPLVTQWAQARRVKVLARFDCQGATAIDRILNDPATRAATLNGLTDLVARYGYDGISIDFEAGAASNRARADELHRRARPPSARLRAAAEHGGLAEVVRQPERTRARGSSTTPRSCRTSTGCSS